MTEQDNSAVVDDTILLSGLDRTTFWKFPQQNFCPHPYCQKDFENRSEAIGHFKSEHAKYAILCSVCEPQKPIYTYSRVGFKAHYRNHHPNAEIPFGFGEPDDDDDDQENGETPEQNDEVR